MTDGSDPRIEERVGEVLNEKWTIERLLGTGGMAAVYQAKHRNGAKAAVKMLHPEIARHAQVRERFLREGYAANKVEHRGTVQVLDDDVVRDGPDEGAAYIVMELLEGESIDQRFDRLGKFSEREVLELMAAVLDVLSAAHERGVVHRDLKPDNLFLARDPDSGAMRLKVLDFGLARLEEATSVTVDGLALGTPHYMSPEQAAGAKDQIDHRTDIFALGATVFLLLTGRHVHEGETILQTVVKMGKDPAPPIRSIEPGISEATAKIVDRALSFEKDARYPTAAAMRADVDAALRKIDMGQAPTIELFAPTSKKGSVPPPAAEKKQDTISLSASDLDSTAENAIRALAATEHPSRETAKMEAAPPVDPNPSSRLTAKLPEPPPIPSPTASTRETEKMPAITAEAAREARDTARSAPPPPVSEPPPKRGGFPFVTMMILAAAVAVGIWKKDEILARMFPTPRPVTPAEVDAGAVTTTEAPAIDAAAASIEDASPATSDRDADIALTVSDAGADAAADAGDEEEDEDAGPTIVTTHDAGPNVAPHVPTSTRPKTPTKKPVPKKPPPAPTGKKK